jgi:hypothetical protein
MIVRVFIRANKEYNSQNRAKSLKYIEITYVPLRFTQRTLMFCTKHEDKSRIRGPIQLQSDWVQQQHETNDE